MGYYIFVATIIFFGYFMYGKTAKQYLIFSMIVLFVFTAFRNISVGGTDVLSYIAFYNNRVPLISQFYSYNPFTDYEIGYAFINSVAKSFFGSFFGFQILYTSISLLLLYLVIEKTGLEDNEKCLLLFVYFTFRYFLNAMGLLRQNIATEIFWLVLLTLMNSDKKNKKLLAYPVTIADWMFHRSSMLCVLFMPFISYLKKQNKIKVLFVTIISSVICLGLSDSVINTLVSVAVRVGGSRFAYFIEEDGRQGFNTINFLFRWVFFIIFYIAVDRLQYEKKNVIFAIGAVAIICGSINVDIFTRMLEYFMIGIYVMVVLSTRLFDERSKKIYALILYILFVVILIRNLHTTSGGLYLNYTFWR